MQRFLPLGNFSIKAIILSLVMISPLFSVEPVSASTKREIKKKIVGAMESYDLLEIDEAKKLLSSALALAKKKNLEADEITADIYLSLGIVYFAGFKDSKKAKEAFKEAAKIKPEISIDPAYKTGEMDALLESAKQEVASAANSGGASTADDEEEVDCSSLRRAMTHSLIDETKAGQDREVSVYVKKSLKASAVTLFFRRKGEPDFTKVKMKKDGRCKYVGVIPKDALSSGFVHYYISAFNSRGKAISKEGTAGSPNIMEVLGVAEDGGQVPDDEENPLSSRKKTSKVVKKEKDEPESGVGLTGKREKKLFFSISVGTGGGLVSGTTEVEENRVDFGFAPDWLHGFPEFGYFLSPQTSIAAGARIGAALGANIERHATGAIGALVRVRHCLSPSGDGVMISGGVGGGLLRHIIPIVQGENGEPIEEGMNVTTTASGPMFLSAGFGYLRSLGGPLTFIFEVNSIVGIPVVDSLGACTSSDDCIKVSFGLQFDVNMGLQFAF